MKQWFKENQDAIIDAGMFLAIVIVVLLMLCLVGCTTTKYVPVETVRTEYKVRTDSVRDSVYLHDSTFVNIYSKNDTIYRELTKWRYQYKFLNKIKNDTVIKTDSIHYVIEHTQTVVEKYPMGKKIRIGMIALLVGFGIGVFRKKIVEWVKILMKL